MAYNEFAAVVGVVLVVLAILSAYNFYIHNMYTADIGQSQLSNILAQTDLTNMKVNLNNALNQLEQYHGNPGLFKEDPYQNYDVIKADIQHVVDNIDKYVAQYGSGSDSSYAYQQTIANTKASAEKIAERIGNAGQNWFTNPTANPIFYTLIIGSFLSPFVICWGSDVVIKHYENKRYYEIRRST